MVVSRKFPNFTVSVSEYIIVSEHNSQFPNITFWFRKTTPSFRINEGFLVSEYHRDPENKGFTANDVGILPVGTMGYSDSWDKDML